MISDLIEEERERKKVAGKDMYGSSAHYDPIELDHSELDDFDDHYYDRPWFNISSFCQANNYATKINPF